MKNFLFSVIMMRENGIDIIKNISDFLEMGNDVEITLKNKKSFYELIDILEEMECEEIPEDGECDFDTDDLEFWYKYKDTIIKVFYLM